MKLFKIFSVLALTAGLVACSREIQPDGLLLSEGNATKVVRLSEEVEEGVLLIKFDAVPQQEDLDNLAREYSASVSPLFPSFPGHEETEQEFGLDRWYEVRLSEGEETDGTVLRLSARADIEMVEYNALAVRESDGAVYPGPETRATAEEFNDPYLSYQWHYNNQGNASFSPTAYKGGDINVKDVWSQLCCGDPSIIVAVVDEGVKYSHPDLAANMWKNEKEIAGNGIDDDGNGYIDDVYGYNFARNGAVSWSESGDSGHGTHCAGTIAAVNNNKVGVAGVAGGSGNGDGCRIMSCQIFSGSGGGSASVVAKAIKYAADMGASVISCSFGYNVSFPSDNYYQKYYSAEIDAVHYFEAVKGNNSVLKDGNIAVFAAGNENQDFAHYPGAFNDIISVSALGPDFLPAYYTNYGPGCNIAAPGGEAYHRVNKWNSMVLSTIPSEVGANGIDGEYNQKGLDYGYMQGTSMACPHVSGVVALGLSYAKQQGKTFTRDEFKRMILASTKDIDQRISKTNSKSYAYGQSDLSMAPYYHQMGTGCIDAWRLMMHIDGIPCSTATIGKSQWISLDNLFGTASVSLTYLSVDVPEATIQALGLQPISGQASSSYPVVPEGETYAYVQFGRLYVYPTKIGSGKISISAVGGGNRVGGGDNPPGGMVLEQELSLIARDVDGGNGTGGWL